MNAIYRWFADGVEYRPHPRVFDAADVASGGSSATLAGGVIGAYLLDELLAIPPDFDADTMRVVLYDLATTPTSDATWDTVFGDRLEPLPDGVFTITWGEDGIFTVDPAVDDGEPEA